MTFAPPAGTSTVTSGPSSATGDVEVVVFSVATVPRVVADASAPGPPSWPFVPFVPLVPLVPLVPGAPAAPRWPRWFQVSFRSPLLHEPLELARRIAPP